MFLSSGNNLINEWTLVWRESGWNPHRSAASQLEVTLPGSQFADEGRNVDHHPAGGTCGSWDGIPWNHVQRFIFNIWNCREGASRAATQGPWSVSAHYPLPFEPTTSGFRTQRTLSEAKASVLRFKPLHEAISLYLRQAYACVPETAEGKSHLP